MVLSSPLVRPGDLVVHMESPQYNTRTAILRNGTATARTVSEIVGYPLKAGASGADYLFAVAGDEASVIALLLDGPPGFVSELIANAANSPTLFQVIHRGAGVVINQNKIRTTDIAAAAFDVAAIVTALKALQFEFRTEPLKVTTL